MVQFLTLGLFQGAIYGLVAVGLVLVYKGTRVFNFAQGEIGTASAYVTWALFDLMDVAMPIAILAGLVTGVLLGLILERLVIRPLFDASRVTVLVATIGVALLIIGITVILGKPEARFLEPVFQGTLILGDTAIEYQQILAVAILVVVGIAMALFFRTHWGLGILAVSQDATATRIVGISVPGMSRLIWGLSGLLAAIAGVMQAPISFLRPGLMTTTALMPAFTAAVLGGMTSLPGAFLGGILVGVAQNLGIFYLGDGGVGIPGAPQLLVFSLLLLVLMIRPQGILGKEA